MRLSRRHSTVGGDRTAQPDRLFSLALPSWATSAAPARSRTRPERLALRQLIRSRRDASAR